jgi:flagellar motor switch protein FliG
MTEQALPAPAAPVAPSLQLTGRKRVAALLITLGTSAAANVLSKLPPETAEKIAADILNTKRVAAEVRDQVLEEAYSALYSHVADIQGGPQYALELFIEAFGEQKGMDLLERVSIAQITPPFDFVLRVEPAQVAQVLEKEHPQTIAIVLAHLEARPAAKILQLLDSTLQVEVARRIALMEPTTPEAIRLVEDGIRLKLSNVAQDTTTVGGPMPLAVILNSADHSASKSVLERLGEIDEELTERVRKLMFVFEDIKLLDDKAMQRLIREIDVKDVALALRRADDELKAKFFGNMSSRAAEMLRDEMSLGGQVRVKNIEDAQGRIIDVIKRLEQSDEIIINRGGDSEFA